MLQVSFVSHFYGNVPVLERAVAQLRQLEQSLGDLIEIVLVDDHTPSGPPLHVLQGLNSLRLYRISEDIPWNQPGARNIGVLESRARLVFLHDIDHVLPLGSVSTFMADIASMVRSERLLFTRKIERADGSLADAKPHLNSFVLDRRDFYCVGGYDEAFSGAYGNDDHAFIWNLRRYGVQDRLSAATLHVLERAHTPELNRSRTRNQALLKELQLRQPPRAPMVFACDYERLI